MPCRWRRAGAAVSSSAVDPTARGTAAPRPGRPRRAGRPAFVPRRRTSRTLRALLGVALLLGAPAAAAGSASMAGGPPERHLHSGALPLAGATPAAATSVGAGPERPEGGAGARIDPARLPYVATVPNVRSRASRVPPAYGPLARWCLAHATSTAEP